MLMDKNTIRKNLKNRRNELTPVEIKKNSSAILEHFTSTLYPLLYKKGAFVVYLSTQSEVMTGGLIRFLHKQNRRIYAPCVRDGCISLSRLAKSCRLVKGAFGISEPPAGHTGIRSFKDISAVIVPGIAFDMKGNRIGFGRGYFDKFLKKLPACAKKIALAFSCQIIRSAPAKHHDVKMDYIITEKGVYEV